MAHTYYENVTLQSHTCGACGITFAAPASFWTDRRETGKEWYCPNGCNRVFTDLESTKLKRQLEAKERELERERRIAANERERAERNDRRRAAAVGQVTKLRKRVGKGVCPCCNRFFDKLHMHMKTKHPEYSDASVDGPTD